jgi:predicted  nucleic acid-binding Zn-ribbon protein
MISRLEQTNKGVNEISKTVDKVVRQQDHTWNYIGKVNDKVGTTITQTGTANELLIDVRSKVKSMSEAQQEFQCLTPKVDWLTEENQRLEYEVKAYKDALRDSQDEVITLEKEIDSLKSRLRRTQEERDREIEKNKQYTTNSSRPEAQHVTQPASNQFRPYNGGFGTKSARYP